MNRERLVVDLFGRPLSIATSLLHDCVHDMLLLRKSALPYYLTQKSVVFASPLISLLGNSRAGMYAAKLRVARKGKPFLIVH